MLSRNVSRLSTWPIIQVLPTATRFQRRALHYDGRNRLSKFWTPTQRQAAEEKQPEHAHDLLARGGFLRQAHSGIFHLLPLGLRVQNKIEALLDKHMLRLGASKVSLSSISSEELWQRSGRLDKGRSSEFLRLEDRKGAKYLLSPTHEEEVTQVLAEAVHSYKDLPLRLYQVSRKYRDELRPRQGLLRSREFVMKDLYTFDASEKAARQTYDEVRAAYAAFLDELRLPYLTATADSGNMGGNLSHEFHFASSNGEDTIIQCDSCDYSFNEELLAVPASSTDTANEIGSADPQSALGESVTEEMFVNEERTRLYRLYYDERQGQLDFTVIKKLLRDVDLNVKGEMALEIYYAWAHGIMDQQKEVYLHDSRVSESADLPSKSQVATVDGQSVQLTKPLATSPPQSEVTGSVPANAASELPPASDGVLDEQRCLQCSSGSLKSHKAVEIGHTFHLGQRYSKPLGAQILGQDNKPVNVEMGCHGIGVSRLIGAMASILSDAHGLNWPLAIAPFQILLTSLPHIDQVDVSQLYDSLAQAGFDVVIDDRQKPMGWKMNDADLVGYPFIVVMGRRWAEKKTNKSVNEKIVELQCRRLGVKRDVKADGELPGRIQVYSSEL